MTKKKILVVDDEPEMLELIRFTMEQNGYDVVTCESGTLAWEAIIDNKPDLVILDLMLPGLDGYSLQEKISKNEATQKLPIIILTALETMEPMFKRFPQVWRYMTKPFKPDDLFKTVQEAIEKGSSS